MRRHRIRKFSIAWWVWQTLRIAIGTAFIILLTMDYYIH